MHLIIEWIAAAALTALGLSQIYRWAFWLDYYATLASHGPRAIRMHGLIVATIGMVITVFHNVWAGVPTVLTLTGWLFVGEGALCLLAPGVGMTSMAASDVALRRRAIIATGVISLIVAGVLWAYLLGGVWSLG